MTGAFELSPRGPFDLPHQVQYFGEWLHEKDDANAIVLAFPVEGWNASAAVSLSQGAAEGEQEGLVRGEVTSSEDVRERAWTQALACLSLDIDGRDWPSVGTRDPVIAAVQEKYRCLRPVLFHSPYEAAAGFIVGHRISIRQRRALVARMAQELGESIDVRGQVVHAFPPPHALLRLPSFPGISPEKIERLHGIARAALDGLLDRARLRSMPIEEARAALQELRGVGPFFADGILHRGAGIVDDVPNDHLTPYAVQKAYGLAKLPSQGELMEIAESWRPFRMWATVLLHVRLRREVGLPKRGPGPGTK